MRRSVVWVSLGLLWGACAESGADTSGDASSSALEDTGGGADGSGGEDTTPDEDVPRADDVLTPGDEGSTDGGLVDVDTPDDVPPPDDAAPDDATPDDAADVDEPPLVVKTLAEAGYGALRLTEVLADGSVGSCAGLVAGFVEVRVVSSYAVDLAGLEVWSDIDSAFVPGPMVVAPGHRAVFAFDPDGFSQCFCTAADGVGPTAPAFSNGAAGIYYEGVVDEWFDWNEPHTPKPIAGVSYTRDENVERWCWETVGMPSGVTASPFTAGWGCAPVEVADAPSLSVTLTPASPTSADDLVAAISGAPEGASFGFAWSVDGKLTAFDGWRLPREVTHPGQTWSLAVTAIAGGNPVTASAAVTIGAAAPAPFVEVLYVHDGDCAQAEVEAIAVDDDGAPVEGALTYAWSFDGTPLEGSGPVIPVAVSAAGTLTCTVTVTTAAGTSSVSRSTAVAALPSALDADLDGVCDVLDLCPGEDDVLGDVDGDGLCATTEAGLGTSDSSTDSDADGLQDADELALGTNPAVADATFPVARLFVTSTDSAPNLGFPEPLDELCQGLASAAGLLGTYRVFASDNETSAVSRAIDRPWFRADGRLIATSLADLLDGSIRVPVNVDENGAPRDTVVYTSTTPSGTPTANRSCESWTGAGASIVGQSSATTGAWLQDNEDFGCSTPAAFYCMGWE